MLIAMFGRQPSTTGSYPRRKSSSLPRLGASLQPLTTGNRIKPMCEGDNQLNIRACRGPEEFAALVEIWRSAVRATHDFLDESDFNRIQSHLASDYFPAVSLAIAEMDGEPVGFAGVLDGGLEMLFVSDAVRGQGIGSALLADAIKNQEVSKVDVNEQNNGARGFYLSRGFVQVGRSELDGDGRPYPTIHMELQTNA